MKNKLYFLVFLILVSCSVSTQNEIEHSNYSPCENAQDTQSTFAKMTLEKELTENNPNQPESMSKLIVDTSNLEGYRTYLRNQFRGGHISSALDTLIDLNFDGRQDYVLIYYGLAGTGLKNRIMVYLQSDGIAYACDSLLSDLCNPTFYLNKKAITSFYIGMGGGHGSKHQWIDGNWKVVKEFEVRNAEDLTKWIVRYPRSNRTDTIYQPYQMIPPVAVLESNVEY